MSTTMQNFIQIGLGVSVLRMRDFAPPKWLGYFFVFEKGYSRDACTDFWRKIRQTTRFRVRKCVLGVAKPKSKVSTPSFHKNSHFWAPFRRDLDFFSNENGFNIGRLESKRPLIAIVFNPLLTGHVIRRMRSGRVRIFNGNQRETL